MGKTFDNSDISSEKLKEKMGELVDKITLDMILESGLTTRELQLLISTQEKHGL